MTTEATDAFCERLMEIVQYFRTEWDLTYAECIGCLQIMIVQLANESLYESDNGAKGADDG